MRDRVQIVWGDITAVAVDAVVNAANCHLSGGDGVDGAIRWAAGSGLEAECAAIGWCDTGDAKLTGGYGLPAKHVLHAVGPVWRGGSQGEADQLRSAYRRCFELADAHGLRSIAFPALSTGVYRYPLAEACSIALEEARAALRRFPGLQKIVFVAFHERSLEAFQQAFAATFRPA